MASFIRKFFSGIGVVPKAASDADEAGELEVLSTDNRLRYHDGITSDRVVTENSTDTLENKSIDADQNTITNIENADIKAAAAIDATKIANGTVSNTEFQYINSLTSNAQDQIDDIIDGSTPLDLLEDYILVGDATDKAAAVDTSAVGDISADSTAGLNIKAGVIVNADINASAAIDATKIADGSISNTEFQYLEGATSNIQDQIDAISGGGGDVNGPASSTDNALARFDLTTGKLIQNSVAILGDTGNLSGIANLTATGTTTLNTSLTGPLKAASGVVSASAINLASEVTGTLPVANGGTGQTSYTDGQLLIGNTTGNTLTKASLTAGTGISITPGAGSITIAATGGGGTVNQFVMSGCSGAGSSNTCVLRFTTSVSTSPSVTYTASSTNGDTFTIGTTGLYAITFIGHNPASTDSYGIMVNDSVGGSTGVDAASGATYAQGLRGITRTASGFANNANWTGNLTSGDVVRIHTNGNTTSTFTNYVSITIAGPF